MSMHLFSSPHPNQPDSARLKLLCAYENGGVVLREFVRTDKGTSVEGVGWEVIWRSKLHVESSAFFPPGRQLNLDSLDLPSHGYGGQ